MMYRLIAAASLLSISLMLGAAACQDQKPLPDDRGSCAGVMCTMMFAAVTVKVQDVAGQPVFLDSSRTLNAAGVLVHSGPGNAGGVYTVVDDSYQKALALRTEAFTFAGYKDGKKVVEGQISVSADCCHVSRARGPEVLTLK